MEAHYFEYMGRVIWYIEIKPAKDPDKIIYLYLDDELRTREEKDYLTRINQKLKQYTIEKFQKKKHHFGTLALLSNIPLKNAEEIYQIYKTRNQIEMPFVVGLQCISVFVYHCICVFVYQCNGLTI